MSDFQTFVAARVTELDYQDSRTEPFVKDATVRQLRELSSQPVDFMEGSFTFSTTANQDNYASGYTGFPVDIFEVFYLYTPSTSSPLVVSQEIVGPVSIKDLRNAQRAAVLSTSPELYAWHDGKLWLSPIPSGVFTVKGDYRRDGTRDSSSGAVITSASTTHSNGWFAEGENVLRCAVILEYHLSISKDQAAIATYGAMLERYKENLSTARNAKRVKGGQPADTMFGYA